MDGFGDIFSVDALTSLSMNGLFYSRKSSSPMVLFLFTVITNKATISEAILMKYSVPNSSEMKSSGTMGGGRSKGTSQEKHDSIFGTAMETNGHSILKDIRIPYKPTSGYAKGGIE